MDDSLIHHRWRLAFAACLSVAACLGCRPWPNGSVAALTDDRAPLKPAVDPDHGKPTGIPRLDSADAAERRAALERLAAPDTGPLPENIARFASDPDHTVRRAALITIASRRNPQAMEIMRRGLADQDVAVRLAAVAGYGLIGTPEATAELQRLTKSPAESIRASAYQALVDFGDRDAVASASADKASQVRCIAAKALDQDPSRKNVALAEKLIVDPNADVVRTTIESLGQWPLADAGPILLKAMEGVPYMPRKLATALLAQRWAPAAAFEVDASTERRAALIADLHQQWQAEFPPGAEPATASIDRHADSVTEPATAAETVERALIEVESLAAGDVRERRKAAAALVEACHDRPLPQPALERLAKLVTAERDALVWIAIFDVLAGDAREPAVRLAYTALSHPAPEVRRRACQYLATHPDRRHEKLLTASLDDANPVVVATAVNALGRLGALADPRPLERLLAANDHVLRVQVAMALAAAGVESGAAALERLSFDPDPNVRQAAARAMGAAPQKSFLPILIRLLDDRPAVCEAALASLSRVAGDGAVRPATAAATSTEGETTAATTDSEIRAWKEWFRNRPALDIQ